MSIDVTSTSAAITTSTTVAPATATADQQSAFDQAMADAQLGIAPSDPTSAATSSDPLHAALFSILQNAVISLMADVDATRKDDSDDS